MLIYLLDGAAKQNVAEILFLPSDFMARLNKRPVLLLSDVLFFLVGNLIILAVFPKIAAFRALTDFD